MNFNNFTIKSQEAVQQAIQLVQSRGQQTIEPEHLLAGVLKVGENVTNFIFQKLGMNGQQVAMVLDRQIMSFPKVSGGEPYLSRGANEVLQKAVAPCNVKWRGDPALQAGDVIQTFDKDTTPHTVLVMSQSIRIGGGCSASIVCSGKSETTSNFSNKFEPTSQKIERLYKTLEKTILDATNKIAGNSGGYVVIHDTNGDTKPDEILVMDKEDIALATKVWRWNKEGLGYAYNAAGNAYNGPYRPAITADGQINADFITTGTLSAERIAVETFDNQTGLLTDYIHFEDGTMVFGEGNSTLKLKLENEQIAFYKDETRIGLFSPNSFEIENLTDGKVRFQNFGFIPRTSGNLTFTKLI